MIGFNNYLYFVNFFNLLPFRHKTFQLKTYLSMVSLYEYVKTKVNTNLRPKAEDGRFTELSYGKARPQAENECREACRGVRSI